MRYDVIVIGGGHAGCEAALASARMGAKTLLLSINNDHLAQMSCNPAIGGIAKGQVVREIDALGGEMALNTDATSIQFRMLNDSKGAAALSPRAQCDKALYQRRMKFVLERTPNLTVHQAEAVEFKHDGERVTGVMTIFGELWEASSFVVCTGTFLGGLLHYGLRSWPGGRAGDPASNDLSRSLHDDLQLEMGRLKTGTPVRVLAKSIDFSSMERQNPDNDGRRFSFREKDCALPVFGSLELEQRPCYMTYTTNETAEVARANLTRSPMYSGKIKGTGARYCPSFEDKIVRFPDRERHHVYLEPEGNSTDEYYLNGISTSLPTDVQWALVHSLPGLENAEISRYAYAIEYDFVHPHQLNNSLALRKWPNLFLAGQINGTSGYEEAAGQGLVAGINAARFAAGRSAMTLGRDQAYIGVMIDDLVTKDIVEPYRLFTSRAEYRLSLRQDNADLRLTEIGYEAGLATRSEYERVCKLKAEIEEAKSQLRSMHMLGKSVWELMMRPDFVYSEHTELPSFNERLFEQLSIDARYEGYIEHQEREARALRKLDCIAIPASFDYKIPGISTEAYLKLTKRKPTNLGQASRIDGVTPAEIAVLQIALRG